MSGAEEEMEQGLEEVNSYECREVVVMSVAVTGSSDLLSSSRAREDWCHTEQGII